MNEMLGCHSMCTCTESGLDAMLPTCGSKHSREKRKKKKKKKEKLCWCISKSTSTENAFEEIFCGVKYLGAMLLIAYLFLCAYDCKDSALTNMNEWIRGELRVMCYIPHQRVEVLLL